MPPGAGDVHVDAAPARDGGAAAPAAARAPRGSAGRPAWAALAAGQEILATPRGCAPGVDSYACVVVGRDDARGEVRVRWLPAAAGGPPGSGDAQGPPQAETTGLDRDWYLRCLASLRYASMCRLPCGRLEGAPAWAAAHPHRDEAVAVRRPAFPRTTGGAVSVATWNVLSREWARRCAADDYAHIAPELLAWPARAKRITGTVLALSPDVAFLQEVDFDCFDDLLAPLAAAGYAGLMQNDRKRAADQPCGVATFWRLDRLRLDWAEHRSRTLLTALSFAPAGGGEGGAAGGAAAVFVNAHLEASQSAEGFATKAAQLDSSLAAAARRAPGGAAVVAGDFNTGADAALCEVLRGGAPWHGFRGASAYEHPAAAATAPAALATFAVGEHKYMIDQFWYNADRVELAEVLEPLEPAAAAGALGPGGPGLPDASVPSDHIPIGAVLRIRPPPAAGAAAGAAPAAEAPPSYDEALAGVLRVLPTEHADELAEIQAMHAPRPEGGVKPAKEAMREFALARRARLAALLDALAPDQASSVARVEELRKRQEKQARRSPPR